MRHSDIIARAKVARKVKVTTSRLQSSVKIVSLMMMVAMAATPDANIFRVLRVIKMS